MDSYNNHIWERVISLNSQNSSVIPEFHTTGTGVFYTLSDIFLNLLLCVCAYVCTCEGQKLVLSVFFKHFPLGFLRQGLSVNLAAQEASGIFLALPLPCQDYRRVPSHSVFVCTHPRVCNRHFTDRIISTNSCIIFLNIKYKLNTYGDYYK